MTRDINLSVKEKPYGDIGTETGRKRGENHADLWFKFEEQYKYQ